MKRVDRGEADWVPTHRMSSSSSKSTLTCGGEEGVGPESNLLEAFFSSTSHPAIGAVLVSASYCPLSLVHWMMVKVQRYRCFLLFAL